MPMMSNISDQWSVRKGAAHNAPNKCCSWAVRPASKRRATHPAKTAAAGISFAVFWLKASSCDTTGSDPLARNSTGILPTLQRCCHIILSSAFVTFCHAGQTDPHAIGSTLPMGWEINCIDDSEVVQSSEIFLRLSC